MKPEIDKAIMAHSAWKSRFREFMSGNIDLDASIVQRKDACDFGKWLAGEGRTQLGQDFAEIDRLHAEFHRAAGSVVDLKKSGKIAEAQEALSLTGEFSRISSLLTKRLMGILAPLFDCHLVVTGPEPSMLACDGLRPPAVANTDLTWPGEHSE